MPAGKFTGCTTISNSELAHNSGLENQKDDILFKAKDQESEKLQCYSQHCHKNLSGQIFGTLCAPPQIPLLKKKKGGGGAGRGGDKYSTPD